MSQKQIDANRQNAKKSTGPRTPAGRAVSRMNALKHAILSREVLIHSRCLKESPLELDALHLRLWDDYNPVGAVEEMLLDQILTAHWRLRRALTAESGEIVLSVDGGNWNRMARDPGNGSTKSKLAELRASVERQGEFTEAALRAFEYADVLPGVKREVQELYERLQEEENPEGLGTSALRAKQKKQALAAIREIQRSYSESEWFSDMVLLAREAAHQAAAVLPSPEVLDKILRYETKLERQMYRAMNQLERIQRMRQGGVVPPPLNIEVSATN